jgi:steroid 5-alpha reductase family enzyme
MTRAERRAVVGILVGVAIGAAVAVAGSQRGATVAGWPVFALCAALSFAINWLVFVPSFIQQTEHYFDLTGSLTYVTVVVTALVLSGAADARALLLAALVVVWAGRLGSFLFARIRRDGRDGRFDALKPSLPRFLMTWTLQGLWVLLTLAPSLAAMTTLQPRPLDLFAAVGLAVWAIGFGIEVVADRQKREFRRHPGNRGRFITTGLWAWSRHPNYFGEITLWTGVALLAAPVLGGWQYLTLVSPLFVYLLLTRVSGIPLLEARAEERWGGDPAYRAYRDRTPPLFPRPPRSA